MIHAWLCLHRTLGVVTKAKCAREQCAIRLHPVVMVPVPGFGRHGVTEASQGAEEKFTEGTSLVGNGNKGTSSEFG